jgi:hypothetical protein
MLLAGKLEESHAKESALMYRLHDAESKIERLQYWLDQIFKATGNRACQGLDRRPTSGVEAAPRWRSNESEQT